jgi:uncharacterized membrane protein YdjX (TVP38/TMEM64 family)
VALPEQSATPDKAKPDEEHHHEPARPSDWVRVALPLIAVVIFVVVAWKHGYFNLKDPQKLGAAAQRVQDIPWLGPIFVAVYAALAAFAAPVSPLAYGAGAVFGVVRGTLFVMIASLLGASGGYFLARSAWSGVARRLLGRFHGKLRKIGSGTVFLTALRVQLLPIVPFGIFNYAAGVGHVPFLPFIGATALGILPGTIAAVYIGDRLLAGITASDRRAFVVAGVVAAALFALSFAPTLITTLRGANGDNEVV